MKLFSENLPFWKANLHTHTTASDGDATPEKAMLMYRDAGYDILAITDHRRVTQVEQTPEGLLVLQGVELDYMLPGQAVHIVGLDVDASLGEKWNRQGTPQQGVDLIRACGGEAILAHPCWSMNTTEFMSSLEGVIATEIWNSVSTIPINPIRADSSAMLDVLSASTGKLLRVVASDDTHRYGPEFAKGATMIQAAENTVPAVMDALRSGRFYATQGPRFHQVSCEQGVVTVNCSPVEHVVFYSALPWASGRCVSASGQTEATYTLHRGERFVRVQLIDAEGRSAWCSPFAVEDER